MAEVVVPGHLPLVPHLRHVVCRTRLDCRTLVHLLGAAAPHFRGQIIPEPVFRSVFLHLGLYLRRAEWSDGALRLDLHPPWPPPREGSHRVQLVDRTPGEEADTYTLEVPRALSSVRITAIHPALENCWEIHLEDALAFHAPLPSESWVLA
jgi:hypothetical protein